MYMGDGTNREIDMEVTSMDYSCGAGEDECNSITGNFLQGQKQFDHRCGARPKQPLFDTTVVNEQ
eukprot:805332-Prorocentrum_minimum.AAC.1